MSGYPATAMGLLCLIGGFMGYTRKGSLPSLLGGVFVGLLYIFSGLALRQNVSSKTGHRGAIAASILLLGSSLPRLAKGPVPVVLAISGVSLTLYYGKALFVKTKL